MQQRLGPLLSQKSGWWLQRAASQTRRVIRPGARSPPGRCQPGHVVATAGPSRAELSVPSHCRHILQPPRPAVLEKVPAGQGRQDAPHAQFALATNVPADRDTAVTAGRAPRIGPRPGPARPLPAGQSAMHGSAAAGPGLSASASSAAGSSARPGAMARSGAARPAGLRAGHLAPALSGRPRGVWLRHPGGGGETPAPARRDFPDPLIAATPLLCRAAPAELSQ